MPDTENPSHTTPASKQQYTPVELSESEYHEIADEYMERLLETCEEAQDEREDLDIEYSVSLPPPFVPVWHVTRTDWFRCRPVL
jgi:frataxin